MPIWRPNSSGLWRGWASTQRPPDILHEMSHVEGLNRQIVASHLREYRKRLRRGGSGSGRRRKKQNEQLARTLGLSQSETRTTSSPSSSSLDPVPVNDTTSFAFFVPGLKLDFTPRKRLSCSASAPESCVQFEHRNNFSAFQPIQNSPSGR